MLKNKYIPVPKWNQYHAYPSVAALRSLIFDSEKNGFSKCLCRVGRRILISENDFFIWIESHKQDK